MALEDLVTRAGELLDRAALAVSPRWGVQRARGRMAINALTDSGFVIPGSRKKSMKGITATANGPDTDIIPKLDGTRSLSRDLFMSSPLAVSILRRHRTLSIGSGLQVQSIPDRGYLGISAEEAELFSGQFEREFDLWAESLNSDFDGINHFGDNQALGYFNMLLSGDFFFMPVWRPALEPDFPYELCIKLIDADLVRNPDTYYEGSTSGPDIRGGVEKDATGRVVAYHVWDTYPSEDFIQGVRGKSVRVPLFDDTGRQQIYHVYDPERISQRRGVPLLANVGEALKQLSRLADAELMNALVSNFFTVFVRDMSGMGALLGEAMTPEETVTGGGRYGPDQSAAAAKYAADGNDIEMGYGNITYLDDKKDITIAQPNKTDREFDAFWKSLATQVCAGGNIPIEQALMRYETSYTAARAAANDVWRYRQVARNLMTRRMCQPIYQELMSEAVLRGRVSAPGYFDDYAYRRAWTRSAWVGSGQGSLDPLREAKAAVLEINSYLNTHEDAYVQRHGGRWDASVDKRSREEAKLQALGLENRPDAAELTGPDGQEDEDPDESV